MSVMNVLLKTNGNGYGRFGKFARRRKLNVYRNGTDGAACGKNCQQYRLPLSSSHIPQNRELATTSQRVEERKQRDFE